MATFVLRGDDLNGERNNPEKQRVIQRLSCDYYYYYYYYYYYVSVVIAVFSTRVRKSS